MKSGSITIAMIGALFCANAALAADVRVTFTGVENAKGNVRAALFSSEESYEANRSMARQMTPADVEVVRIVFENLAPGSYCIASFHDLDADAELDRNYFGAPKEPYGYSNDPRRRTGPPSFDEISFEVGDEPVHLEIQLH